MNKYTQYLEELNTKERKPANYTYFKTPDDKSIIVPFSDIHAGSSDFLQKQFEENLTWTYEKKNAYIILNGDLIEANVRNGVGTGLFKQWEPQKQLDYIVGCFKPFADDKRIIAITNGNHEDRVTKCTGFDLTAIFAKEFNVPYLHNGGFIDIKVKDILYHFYITHGSSGSTLPHTKSRAVRDLSTFINNVDVFCYGHVHTKEASTQTIYMPNAKGKGVTTKTVHYVLTGHYLDYLNSYAQMKSMRPSDTGTPKVKLSGLEKRIRVSI